MLQFSFQQVYLRFLSRKPADVITRFVQSNHNAHYVRVTHKVLALCGMTFEYFPNITTRNVTRK